MKAMLFTLTLLGSQPVILISDRLPELKYEALCNDSTVISAKACMRDETAAQQQLNSIWQTTPSSVRDSCEAEAIAG